MVDLAPDDLCACGSRRRYADCHQPIFDAEPGKAIGIAQEIYSREWSDNAAAYEQQGLYRWLASELRRRVSKGILLDVGCGLANGIDALRSRLPNMQLIGIDENAFCLRKAAAHLGIGIPEGHVDRIDQDEISDQRYRASYRSGSLAAGGPVNLLQSNILLEDPAFEDLLDSVGPLDAITQWFCGIHKASSLTEVAAQHEINSDADNRAAVEEATANLAQKRLRKGGWLNIAVRVGFPNPSMAVAEVGNEYRDLFYDTDLAIQDVLVSRYREDTTGIRVRSKIEAINDRPTFAVSLLIEKMR